VGHAEESTARIDGAGTESARSPDDVAARAEELDRRAAELDAREAAVRDATSDVDFRSTQLEAREAEVAYRSAQLDTREAELASRSAQLDVRDAELGVRSARLDAREAELGERETALDGLANTERADGASRSPREDVHLAVAPDHGYRLIAREGLVPSPGAIVELDDVRYRCLRVQASPFPGDDRPCAVLELLPPEQQEQEQEHDEQEHPSASATG
jgi:hypothetical protein